MAQKTKSNSFKREEKIKSSLKINHILTHGEKLINSPLKLCYLKSWGKRDATIQVAFSVPKKLIKSAVDRNLIKRRISESYRKNKFLLFDSLKKKTSICICSLDINLLK